MAAFKAHCSLFFWRGIDVSPWLGKTGATKSGMGQLGKIAALADLPKDAVLLACVRGAMEQRDSPVARAKRPRRPAKELPVPAELQQALAANAKAQATFTTFAPSHRRAYIEWITGAKQPATRARRLQTTLEWLAEGKPHNWKYLAERRPK